MNILILIISLSISYIIDNSFNEWVLKKEENNIKVFLRDKNPTKEYLAETIINIDIESIYNTIIDFDNAHKWMYKLKSSEILKKESEDLFYVYFTVDMNWPLKNRDLVSDVFIEKGQDEIIIELNSRPEFVKNIDRFIRIIDSKSIWILSKINDNKTKVTLQSYAKVDGIPSFITDLFILESPIYSLSNLRKKF